MQAAYLNLTPAPPLQKRWAVPRIHITKAASLILLHPHHLAAAVLFRAQVPFTPDIIRNFTGLSVLISAGTQDTIVPRDQTEQLAAILRSGGVDVSLCWHRGGHELGDDDMAAARAWFSDNVIKRLAA